MHPGPVSRSGGGRKDTPCPRNSTNAHSTSVNRHTERANLLYFDGHTERFDMDTLHAQAEQQLKQPNMLVLK